MRLQNAGQKIGTSTAAKLQVQFGAGQILLNFALHSTYQFQFDITAQQILAMNSRALRKCRPL